MIYKKPLLTADQRKIWDDRQQIEETGQSSDLKAAKVINQLSRQYQLEEAVKRDNYLTELESRIKFNNYNHILAKITVDYLKEEALDRDVGFKVFYDINGVVMHIYFKGRVFQRAFRAVRIPHIDLNATKMLAISASSLISKLRKNGQSGIIAR